MGDNYYIFVVFTIGILQANLSSSSEEAFPKKIGLWSFPYPTHPKSTCVLLQGGIQLHFRSTAGNKTLEPIDVPSDAIVYRGTCDETTQSLALSWPSPSPSSKTKYFNILSFNFTLQPNIQQYYISKIEYGSKIIREDVMSKTGDMNEIQGYFPDILASASGNTVSHNKSFTCKNEEWFSRDLTLFIIDFQYEAFRPLYLNPYIFDPSEDCQIKSSLPYPKNYGTWTVNYPESDQRSCILLAGAIQLQYQAIPGDNSTHRIIDVPRNADTLGDCGQYSHSITLIWYTYDSSRNGLFHDLGIYFKLDEMNEYYISEINFGIISDYGDKGNHSLTPVAQALPHDKGYFTHVGTKGEFYFAKLNQSYLCNKNQTITGDLTVLTTDLQYEAFRPMTLKKYEFDTPIVCKEDELNLLTESSNYILIPNGGAYPDNVGNWSVKCGPSRSSILLTGAIQFQFVPLESIDSGGNLKIIDVPQDAESSGKCADSENCYISLFWKMAQEKGRDFSLDIHFSITPDDPTTYFIHKIEYSTFKFTHKGPNSMNPSLRDDMFSVWTDGEFYTTHLNHSYLCTNEQTIKGDLLVRTTGLQFEAFRPNHLKEFEFDPAEECQDSTTTTTTPSPVTMNTTTQKPIPLDPFPKNVGNWSYNYHAKNTSSCIVVSGAFQLQFLTSLNNRDNVELLDIPKDAVVHSGTCENTTDSDQSLFLSWTALDVNGTETNTSYGFLVHFTTDPDEKHQYRISDFVLFIHKSGNESDSMELPWEQLDNDVYIILAWTQGEFCPTKLNRSFVCLNKQEITGNLTVRTDDLHFEAFRPLYLKEFEFDEAETCKSDIVVIADTVGIVIGSILTILLGICIGGYLGVRYGLFRKIRSCFRREDPDYQPLNNGA